MVGLQPSSIPVTPGVQILSAGMAACFADLITFPLDTSKVRLQIQGEATRSSEVGVPKSIKYRGVWGTIGTIVRTEGPRSLYNGLIAGLQRQMIFASIRIGLYDSVKQLYTGQDGNTGMVVRLLAGCTTGALAVLVAQPTDVVKVRFQAQVNLRGVTKRYHGTLQAYKSIAREEGIRGLWKGTLPNIARNAIVNCSELVTYDIIKEAILRENLLTDNFPCHFLSAFGAGFCATVAASPVDVVKTRYMNSAPGHYKSALNCAWKMLSNEGPTAFYKGFFPSYLRLGSWNVIMFVTYEQLQRAMMIVKQSYDRAA